MVQLTPEQRAIVDAPNLAHFVTLMKDGSPQITPVWVDHDGTHILINTAEGRQKALNLHRDPRVALTVVDKANDHRWLQVRGRVVELTTGDVAEQHINKLSHKYSGRDYSYRPGERRLLLRITPEHLTYRGS
jgi:PPOX class probable F420-dependent enzyme